MGEGGASKRKRNMETTTQSDPQIVLHIKAQDGQDGFYRFPRNKRLKHLFSQYSKEKNFEYDTLRFFCNGERINAMKTPAEIGLEDCDEIDAMGFQQGGGKLIHVKLF